MSVVKKKLSHKKITTNTGYRACTTSRKDERREQGKRANPPYMGFFQ